MGAHCTQDNLISVLSKSQNLILLSHHDPDGDSLGAELVLSRAMKSLGKEVRIINIGVLADIYDWMVNENEVEYYPHGGPFPDQLNADLIVGLDFNGWDRLLGFEQIVKASGIKTAIIDHHPNLPASADFSYVDVSACCTGLLVWEIIKKMGVNLNLEMAQACYVCLITDTGYFRYSNTDIKAHQLATELLQCGVNPLEMYQHIYESSSIERLSALGQVLSHMKTAKDGQIAWSLLSVEDCEGFGIKPEETEGFIDVIRSLKTVDVSVFFREISKGFVKVSMRSRRLDISMFAKKFDGGGHTHAAGMNMKGPLQESVDSLIVELKKQF